MTIDLATVFRKVSPPPMSANERRKIKILLVDSEMLIRNAMRQALIAQGYQHVSDAADHNGALKKLEDHPFSHVIFEAKHTNLPPRLFLSSLLERDRALIAIPSSYTPTLDDVFDLLISGAKGFLVKPFNAASLDDAIAWATKGEPIAEAVLHAKDRNHALAALILSSLDRLTLVMRQSSQFETARREVPRRANIFRRSIEIAQAFCNGGEGELLSALINSATDKAQGSSSRVTRGGRDNLRARNGRGGPSAQRSEVERAPSMEEGEPADEQLDTPETSTPSRR